MIEYILPFPPTTGNHQHIQLRNGKRILRRDVISWREEISEIVRLRGGVGLGYEHVAMAMRVYMPDNRKRDLGNIEKLVSDALEQAGAFIDDSLLRRIYLFHCGVDKECPRLEIRIAQIRQERKRGNKRKKYKCIVDDDAIDFLLEDTYHG